MDIPGENLHCSAFICLNYYLLYIWALFTFQKESIHFFSARNLSLILLNLSCLISVNNSFILFFPQSHTCFIILFHLNNNSERQSLSNCEIPYLVITSAIIITGYMLAYSFIKIIFKNLWIKLPHCPKWTHAINF